MAKKKKGKSYIGTSGWHYKHWMGNFYPSDLKPRQLIDFYVQYFNTLEINSSFYRLPPLKTFQGWRTQVPEDFIFAVKANRFITHMKKLKDPKETIGNFFESVKGLEEKLGPILFQLPPNWKFNQERLEEFLAALPQGYRYTFEFRNQTWYNDIVFDLLKKYNSAFCIYELDHHLSPMKATSSFIYVRLHGPGGKYAGSYSNKALTGWADNCIKWNEEKKDVFVYFDNDQLGFAAKNAKKLKEMIELKGKN